MRKITLFAVAALTASSAFAVGPTRYSALKPTKVAEPVVMTKAVAKSDVLRTDALKAESRADEVEATPSAYPLYTAEGVFYLGVGQDLGSWKYQFGFAPAHSKIGFIPVVEADTYNWSWEEYLSSTESEIHTADTQALIIDMQPRMEFAGPTLKVAAGSTVVEYNDSVYAYLAGGDTYLNGFYTGDKTSSEIDINGLVGVTPCVFKGDRWGSYFESTIDRTDTEGRNANGVAIDWENDVFADYKVDENGEPVVDDEGNPILEPIYKDVAINGFSYKVPQMTAPYQFSGIYFWVVASTTAEVPLTATVYGYDEEGYLDRSIVLGKGTAILPNTSTVEGGTFQGTIRFDIQAVNSLGLPTNSPICTSEAMFVSVDGLDNAALTYFSPVYNGNLLAPKNDVRNAVYKTIYPQRSILNMTATNLETNEPEELLYGNPYLYSRATDTENYAFAREFAAYIFANFPIVMNGMTGLGDFDATIPVDGGSETLYVVSTEDIAQLYEDMEIDAVASDDWFDFTVAYDETNECATITVSAEALPAGMEGRAGTIEFTGYACDFTVTVTQGTAGINAVVNGAANGASEYFDLQGRRLTSAPAKGLYIERNGKTAATKLAR